MRHSRERLQRRLAEMISLWLAREGAEIAPLLSLTRLEVRGGEEVRAFVHAPDADREEVVHRLQAQAPRLRQSLVRRLRIARIPRLRFVWDEDFERAERVSARIIRRRREQA